MKNVHKMDICRASDSFLAAMGHIRDFFFFLRLVCEAMRATTGDPSAHLDLRSEAHTDNDGAFFIPLTLTQRDQILLTRLKEYYGLPLGENLLFWKRTEKYLNRMFYQSWWCMLRLSS